MGIGELCSPNAALEIQIRKGNNCRWIGNETLLNFRNTYFETKETMNAYTHENDNEV
jgi:hypothetical protein